MTDIPDNLIDGQARAALHPETFEIPSLREISEIKAGDHVKIGLLHDDDSGERFWVKISRTPGTGDDTVFEAVIDQDLASFPEYPDQSSIRFRCRHILGIMPATFKN
ncbi:hypothetical protein [Sulfitobacter sp. R18_1]|uniref:hypothetical protein n=1 Tax=Sulfitobacter sp. R18_1 TaxID=2821104 RepID=UPI001AD98CBB|nr:hypothetical protein [Sulfitobacter sp. R18_1]MBO9428114.1 hypothetical protein [Sulfitobacter sp. R18_1]